MGNSKSMVRNVVKRLIPSYFKDKIRKNIYINPNTANADLRKKVFDKKRAEGMDTIPIFILSFNRKDCLKQFIDAVRKKVNNPIYIIDNNSSYPPLLEYLDELEKDGITVFRRTDNTGHMTFFSKDDYKEFRQDFYIHSDPDVILMDECPDDFVERMFNVLEKYPNIQKVGISQNIKDIPKTSKFYKNLNVLEQRQFKPVRYVKEADAYATPTDTSFALYPPESIANDDFFSSLRLAYPYQAIHIPWMKDKDLITPEDEYYYSHRASFTGAYNPVNKKKNDIKF